MVDSGRIRKVVILGRDDALWLSANVLQRAFQHTDLDITVVELPSMLRNGDVYPTLRQQEAYHSLMGFKEAPLMAASQATFSLGQRFSNFSKTRAPFYHAYSSYGRPINNVPFLHYWVKARAAGLKADFDDFSINAAAARQGKFFAPGPDTDGFAQSDYGYNLEAVGYCQTLKLVALQRQVNHIQGRLAEAIRNPQSGYITALKLLSGQVVEGDLFIDASGAESLLLGQAMGVERQSWGQWFPCDRLLTTYAPPLSPWPSFSQVSAFRSGWVGMFPLRDRTAIQQVYSSVDMKAEEAFEAAGMVTSMRLNPDAVVTNFDPGVRLSLWEKNCIGIGEAAAILDPIDSARMHVNLIGLSHLVSLFPVDRINMLESVEYSRNVTDTLERIRDYQICHYKLNQRFDQPLWDHARNAAMPDKLQYKVELFAARGNLAIYDDETFQEDDWNAMLIGHGLIPRAYDPQADQVPDGDVIQQFQRMLAFIRANVEKMQPMEAQFGLMAGA